MASSYAALVSLVHVLNRVQHPACPVSFDELQIRSLSEKVDSLVDFLETYSRKISKELARKMVVAAFAAEDTIETYMMHHILERSTPRKKKDGKAKEGSSCDVKEMEEKISQDLEKAMQEMDLIVQEAMEVKENNGGEDDQLNRSHIRVDSSVPPTDTIKMIGFDDELARLMGQITARQPGRQIIPIVGMGGIGKTTLARNVFNHLPFNHYFDVKAWVTISQELNVGNIIRPLLRDIGVANVDRLYDSDLGEKLHKSLYGRKYLIILDDIWDTKAWDAISRFCPDNNNGSRILLTTRNLDVARNVGSCSPFDIELLDDNKSWDLLSTKVFGKEACPPELEECGNKISKSCKGLPLAIVVIGGLLKMSEKTSEHWEDVSGNISSIISGEDGKHCLKILSLSYDQLPIHLKPCFLYLATYPYDDEIRVSQLIKLWAADGFLRPNVCDVTLEEVALKYLNDLANRNLITVNKLTSRGRIKVVSLHDLVMDLCIIEVKKERFLCVDNDAKESLEMMESRRRIVFRGSKCKSMKPEAFPRSFVSFVEGYYELPRYSLLRVVSVEFAERADRVEQLVNLRFLRVSLEEDCRNMFFRISLFWNLETLIIHSQQPYLNHEIWSLRHIKHLIFHRAVDFPDPPTSDADDVFQNLQTLSVVNNMTKVLDKIPNIKTLGIALVGTNDGELSLHSGKLAHCHKLETLRLVGSRHNLMNIKFPNFIRKLSLAYFVFPRGESSVGSLLNLQVLKLFQCDFGENEWDTVEGEFQSLVLLSLDRCNLVNWATEECSHFPSLERLSLQKLWGLDKIPEVFGESVTLESIELYDCSKSAVISAKQILDEQQSRDNYGLKVKVVKDLFFLQAAAKEEMRADLENLANDYFHVTLTE